MEVRQLEAAGEDELHRDCHCHCDEAYDDAVNRIVLRDGTVVTTAQAGSHERTRAAAAGEDGGARTSSGNWRHVYDSNPLPGTPLSMSGRSAQSLRRTETDGQREGAPSFECISRPVAGREEGPATARLAPHKPEALFTVIWATAGQLANVHAAVRSLLLIHPARGGGA